MVLFDDQNVTQDLVFRQGVEGGYEQGCHLVWRRERKANDDDSWTDHSRHSKQRAKVQIHSEHDAALPSSFFQNEFILGAMETSPERG